MPNELGSISRSVSFQNGNQICRFLDFYYEAGGGLTTEYILVTTVFSWSITKSETNLQTTEQ